MFISSQGASNRVEEIESSHEVESQGQNRRTSTVYVFYSYFFHLVIRACLAITFSALQYTYFYSSGFPFEFNCNYNSTVISCKNAKASQKRSSGIFVCVLNSIVAFVILVEVIYLLRRLAICNHCHQAGWNVDYEFVTVYFLGKRYDHEINSPERNTQDNTVAEPNVSEHSTGNNTQEIVPDEHIPLLSIENNIPDSNSQDNTVTEPNVPEHSTGNNTQDIVPDEHIPLLSIENNIPDSNTQDNTVTEPNVPEHSKGHNTQDIVSDEHIRLSIENNIPDSNTQDNTVTEPNVQENSTGNNTQDIVPDEHIPLLSIENNIPHSNTQDNTVTEPNVPEHSTGNKTQDIVPDEHTPLLSIENNIPHSNTQDNTVTEPNVPRHSTENNAQDIVPDKHIPLSIENNIPDSNNQDNTVTEPNVPEHSTGNNTQDIVPDEHTCIPLLSIENNIPDSNTQDNTVTEPIVPEHSKGHNTQDIVPDEHTCIPLLSIENNIPDSNTQDNTVTEPNVPEHSTGNNTQDIVPDQHIPLSSIENNIPDSNTQDNGVTEPDVPRHSIENNNEVQDSMNQNNIRDPGSHDPIQFYKTQVLDRCLAPQINYLRNKSLDDFYIDVVIHTERARHKFSKDMKRHEIYDVYTEVPPTSRLLEKIKDLFHPNKDTKGNVPRSILAIGRPGIGKTVLTEKIIRDWAKSVDEYYDNKIALIFKFRWFSGNIEKFTHITLKKFLQLGTSLSDVEFERIYKEIKKEPQRAILIFDGLDEFHGNYMHCLDESRRESNNPDTRMSAMNLFVKLVQGNMLKGATVLVTSRPTAEYFYSKLNFDQDVEILGFTRKKIKDYVATFCKNNNTSNLKPMMWQHVESNSELLNLCYIPVNCFIVCVTLSGCLGDSQNNSSALPTTLTELYQKAVHYFEKYERDRNENSSQTTEKTFKELQELAFDGMKQGRLIFQQKEVSEPMKNSCLLNSLPDLAFTIQAQFCFTHLTIQEFLAAKHVTETLDAREVKKFISDRIQSRKWHLVLQFVAGLLGQKIKMSDGELYKDCVLAFANLLKVTNDSIDLSGRNVFLIKCLRELDNENIANEICETTDMNNVRRVLMNTRPYHLSPSEWAAVTFVCKRLRNLAELELIHPSADDLQEVEELLQGRCLNALIVDLDNIQTFSWTSIEAEQLFSALTKSDCKLEHSHTMLTTLSLDYRGRATNHFPNIWSFFSSDNASHLKKLILGFEIHSNDLSKLIEAFNNNHCTKITELHVEVSRDDEDATAPLWDTLCKGLCKLSTLSLSAAISEQCMLKLCNALQDERCQLTDLSLHDNSMGDKGACMLFKDGLTQEHCKLTKLNLGRCSLTDQCIPSLCKALQDERCRLTDLKLGSKDIGDKGACMLFENGSTQEHCKLTKLDLGGCWLTDQCIPSLCKALQDERCRLTDLSLVSNWIRDKGACTLFENGLAQEHCKLTKLDLGCCSLTDQCIPSLRKALQDERCRMTDLSLQFNGIGDKEAWMLFKDGLTQEHCKLTKLDLAGCSLTDQCIPSLLNALQDKHCRLVELQLWSNKFTKGGQQSIRKITENCKERGLDIQVRFNWRMSVK